MLKTMVMLLLSLTITTSSFADCVSDCKAVIKAADKTIADLNTEIDLYKSQNTNLSNQVTTLQVALNNKNQADSSLLRNPWFIGTLGILVGGGATLYLMKR